MLEKVINTCGKCNYFFTTSSNGQTGCRLTGIKVTADEYCSKGNFMDKDNINICEICGNPIQEPAERVVVEIIDGKLHTICGTCMEHHLKTCKVCDNRNRCDFETNPSTLPKTIQKSVQNGPMHMVTQVRNPERIKITCEKGCGCWNKEGYCNRDYQCCGNYKQTYTT